ncbi:MAG: glycosyltransferase family 4 protein [Hyphomonadaceae bacterium]|nr:MAG: glycosyl transferase [Caulobacteraceae bacterium]MBT9446297.1 glycosyltransferase family 4 protein [Hyphomonadaceae bacterium]TPW08866.1 MAG: glycosyl transferase [Alphaproteobacteria bacterium]
MMQAPNPRTGADTPRVIIVGGLAPPMVGMGVVTSRVADALDARGKTIATINLTITHVGGAVRQMVKAGRILKGAALLWANRRVEGRTLYMPCDAGAGKIYMLFLAMVADRLGYRTILHHHTFVYVYERDPMIAHILRAIEKSGVHVMLCGCMERQFLERYAHDVHGPIGTTVLKNEILFPRVEPDRLPKSATITLGHLSNLTWEKGSGEFLDLFEHLVESGVDAYAQLAGGTADPALEEKIKVVTARHPDRLKWIARTTPENKAKFFTDIDFFVFPTRYKVEGQPLVLAEARARGVPVITIDRGCIGEDHLGAPNLVVAQDADFKAIASQWLIERRFANSSEPHSAEIDANDAMERFIDLF